MSNLKQSGVLFVLVGPSGSGKDTLLDYVRDTLTADRNIGFVKRVITRPDDSGGEDHIGMDADLFSAEEAKGSFCCVWHAHGLSYGLPTEMKYDLAEGKSLIVNGSRNALELICSIAAQSLVIELTVERDELKRRLLARGRETADQVEARLNRAANLLPAELDIHQIDNSGAIENAGQEFLKVIRDKTLKVSE